MAVSGNWIRSLKVLLISTGVVSIAMMVNFSVPLMVDFVVYRIPVIWSTLLSWLRPPYLYFIINGIIITIAASSRFHQKHEVRSEAEHVDSLKLPPADLRSAVAVSPPHQIALAESPAVYETESEVTVPEEKTITTVMDGPEAEGEDEEEAVVISKSNASDFQTEFLFPTPEKPLVSARFGHRKPIKGSPEGGRALRVAKPKRHETLENTWKMITDGRPMPLTRRLTKSDSFSTTTAPLSELSQQDVKKSETFRHRANNDAQPSPATFSPASAKLLKEPSLSQDELNRRVEAFIRKFNEEMRLQRQESLEQYMEMINRGAH